jgi:hypothetical protein
VLEKAALDEWPGRDDADDGHAAARPADARPRESRDTR